MIIPGTVIERRNQRSTVPANPISPPPTQSVLLQVFSIMTRPSVVTLPATAPIADILEVLHDDGVIVLSDFVRSPSPFHAAAIPELWHN